MFKSHEVREIVRLMEQASIREIVVTTEDSHIALRRRASRIPSEVSQDVPFRNEPTRKIEEPLAVSNGKTHSASTPAIPTVTESKLDVQPDYSTDTQNGTLQQIVSPMVGTFYQAPEEGAEPYVKVGDPVTKNTIVCIVEAMKLFNEIEAEMEGTIAEILVQNGQLVEHGQPLFLLKP